MHSDSIGILCTAWCTTQNKTITLVSSSWPYERQNVFPEVKCSQLLKIEICETLSGVSVYDLVVLKGWILLYPYTVNLSNTDD